MPVGQLAPVRSSAKGVIHYDAICTEIGEKIPRFIGVVAGINCGRSQKVYVHGQSVTAGSAPVHDAGSASDETRLLGRPVFIAVRYVFGPVVPPFALSLVAVIEVEFTVYNIPFVEMSQYIICA